MRILFVLVLVACSYPSPSRDDAASGPATTVTKDSIDPIKPTHAAATRARPAGTFDLLSEAVAPGQLVTQLAVLPDGWHVIGLPRVLAVDPSTGQALKFSIESAKTEGDRYTVVARNAGTAPARLIADVPCSGCP